jgi:hypothetical protein
MPHRARGISVLNVPQRTIAERTCVLAVGPVGVWALWLFGDEHLGGEEQAAIDTSALCDCWTRATAAYANQEYR